MLPFEIDPQRLEASLAQLRDGVTKWARKGRATKVRFKFRGKRLLPDLPLAAVVAAEGLTFYWTGILRALVFNLAGRTLLDVELVNDSERRLDEGKAALLAGELDEALAAFEAAERMDHDNPRVLLSLGAALKLKGRRDEARTVLERARSVAPEEPTAAEATRLLATLAPSAPGAPRPPSATPPGD